MATVGRTLDEKVFRFYEGLRMFDAGMACEVLSEDARVSTPWTGTVVGREAAQEALEKILQDPVARPSFTIVDVEGHGPVTRLKLSVSGRFGRGPRLHWLHALNVHGELHQVVLAPV